MVQDFSWKTGAVTLYFEVDAADHVCDEKCAVG